MAPIVKLTHTQRCAQTKERNQQRRALCHIEADKRNALWRTLTNSCQLESLHARPGACLKQLKQLTPITKEPSR